jgi:hypothetical protein
MAIQQTTATSSLIAREFGDFDRTEAEPLDERDDTFGSVVEAPDRHPRGHRSVVRIERRNVLEWSADGLLVEGSEAT